MKDTLEKMLAAEKQAEEIVAEAESQAKATLDEALRRAAETISRAREAAHEQARKIMDDAVKAAQDEKAERLDEIRRQLESLPAQVPDDRRQEAARLILNAVLMEE